MKWNPRINWEALVHEAKIRRKKNGLTQKRLAVLAGISTPTVSHFESGNQHISISSILAIFGVVGMYDQRSFIIIEDIDHSSYYDSFNKLVIFWGKTANNIHIKCQITDKILIDHFDNNGIKAFKENKEIIEHEARRIYLGRLCQESNKNNLIDNLIIIDKWEY